jgi:cell division protein FtsQ
MRGRGGRAGMNETLLPPERRPAPLGEDAVQGGGAQEEEPPWEEPQWDETEWGVPPSDATGGASRASAGAGGSQEAERERPPGPPPPPPPRVDPRFRRRWAEARRAEGRRRLKVLLGAMGVLCLVGAGIGALHSPLFALRHVVVRGNAHTPRAEILSAAGLRLGTTLMVGAGGERAARAVDALPWVRDVSFARRWPWSLVVTVQERSPAALVKAGNQLFDVVDKTGRVLEAVQARSAPTLPLVSGAASAAPGHYVSPVAPATQGELDALLSAAAVTPAILAKRRLELSYSTVDGLEARIPGTPATVVLGRASNLPYKLAVLGELAKRVPLSGYSLVDLTVPGSPALTPSGG